jgi:imidazolonepropionase-like amidohydrolase
MLEHGTYLVPTLLAPRGVLEAAAAGVPVPPEAVEKTRMVMAAHNASVTAAIAAGVKVAMGTDSGVTPHGQNLRELALMVECGMTPIHALVATTRTAAQLLGIAEHTGTLEPGKVADVVVLAGEALDLDDLAGRVRGVYQAGVLVSRGRPAG